MAETDLIVGRKQLMVFLGINGNWNAVDKMIKRQACPIGKVGGRWSGQRHLLLAWLTSRQGGGEPVKSCQNLQDLTLKARNKSLETLSKKRNFTMQSFLVNYRGCMTISGACNASGISRQTYHNWRQRFDRFDAACRQIEEEVQGNGNNYEETATGKEEISSYQEETGNTGYQEACC